MKKIFVVFGVMLLTCSQQHKVDWLRGPFTHALDVAREQNRPILVDFYSDT